MSWKCVVTNGGNNALALLAGGEHSLTITKVTTGSGYVAEINMRIATALQDEKMNGAIVSKSDETDGVTIRLRTGPASVLVGAFTAHEIGLWGKIDNGTELLLVLCQDAETGIDVPTVTENPEFVFDLFVTIACSNTDSLTVVVDPSVYVTNTQFAVVVQDIEYIKRGSEADAIYHLGFYIDDDGDLCQVDVDEE